MPEFRQQPVTWIEKLLDTMGQRSKNQLTPRISIRFDNGLVFHSIHNATVLMI